MTLLTSVFEKSSREVTWGHLRSQISNKEQFSIFYKTRLTMQIIEKKTKLVTSAVEGVWRQLNVA